MKKKVLVLIIICFGIFIYYKNSSSYDNYENIVVQEPNNDITNEVVKEEKIKIHILGEVNSPGIIELNAGSRVSDAIEIAGGATEQADISKINLAYILSDGEKIYIPNINEKNVEETEFNTEISKININTASLEKLQSLNGVGKSTAQKIIDYRNKNGKFAKIEDIMNVSGIGESKFESIKDNICVK